MGRVTVGLCVVLCLAGRASGQEKALGYQDEEKVKRFDHHYGQAKANLDTADEERLRNDAFRRDFASRTKNAKDALDGVSVQGHGEVTRRRRLLEELQANFQQRCATADAGLGQQDRATIAAVDAEREKLLLAVLEADGKRTILTGPPPAPTEHDAKLKQLRQRLEGLRNKTHDEARAATARLGEADDAVAAARAGCERKLAELGDVARLATEHSQWILSHHHIDPTRNKLLPAPPEPPTVEGYRAYAAALMTAVAELQGRVDLLDLLPVWAPWARSERTGRAAQVAREALRDPTSKVAFGGRSYGKVEDPHAFTLAQVDGIGVKELREAAGWPDNWYSSALKESILQAECVAAFREAYRGKADPKVARILGELREKLARFEARVAAQLDAERLPAPGPGHARYAKIARDALPGALAVVVASDLQHFEGTETTKQEIGRRGVGNGMDEVTFRVHKYPYDYDLLEVYAVFEESGVCKVYYAELKEHHRQYGDEPLGRWFLDGKYVQHCIRRQNVVVPDVAGEATPAPAAPAPVSAPVTEDGAPPPAPAASPVAAAAPEDVPVGGLGLAVGGVLGCGCLLVVLAGGAAAVYFASKAKAPAPPPA